MRGFSQGLASAVCGALLVWGAWCWLGLEPPSGPASGAAETLAEGEVMLSGETARLPRASQAAEAQLVQRGRNYAQGRFGSGGPMVEPEDEQPWLAPGLTEAERAAVFVYHRANRSVVNINTKNVRTLHLVMLELTNEGAGSGCVLDKSGRILTNYHVIEDAGRIAVTLYNGQTYDAKVVGADRPTDIAVVQIDAPPEELHPLPIGDSRDLRVGMQVYAIGNPFGLERTLTAGIVSSLNRTLGITRGRSIRSIIQIDAAINPGSSGGPLLNTRAELVGLNTAIASTTGQSSGVGFAIPTTLVQRVVPELISHGRFIRPEVGIVKVLETGEGLLILSVDADGPAARAGLRGPAMVKRRVGFFTQEVEDRKAADLIVAVNEIETKTADDFLTTVESHQPGESVRITVLRDGKPLTRVVELVASGSR